MTAQDLVETFVEEAVRALKKNHRRRPEGRALDRHEPVEIQGYAYTTDDEEQRTLNGSLFVFLRKWGCI